MTQHTFTDRDGDKYTVEANDTFVVIKHRCGCGREDETEAVEIYLDDAETLAQLILDAAKEARN